MKILYALIFIFVLAHLHINAQTVACQESIIFFDTAHCIPQPVVEDGFLYFNLCKNDSLKLVAQTQYPENNIGYTQHDSLHTFRWTFTEDDLIITEGDTFCWFQYNEVSGYDISISMTDTNNCNSNTAIARVRIAGSPINGIGTNDHYCLNDSLLLATSEFGQVTPYAYEHTSVQKFESVRFLPDGPDCPPGYYFTDVVFNAFLPDQLITSPNDILSVCVNMEHSYMGDLTFEMICPNGQSVMLKTFRQLNHIMGEPAGMPNPRALDDDEENCIASYNPAGTGWNYCWSEIYPSVGTMSEGNIIGNNQLDSTYLSINEHYFVPDSSFNGLVGCPLNGLWTIKITDRLAIDNGYIFEWTLSLDESLLPPGWSYSVGTDSIGIIGPNIVYTDTDTTLIALNNTGYQQYNYLVTDDYGCSADTVFGFDVMPLPDFQFGGDTTVCPNQATNLQGTYNESWAYVWNTGSNDSLITVLNTGLYWCEVTDTNQCVHRDSMELFHYPKPAPISIFHD